MTYSLADINPCPRCKGIDPRRRPPGARCDICQVEPRPVEKRITHIKTAPGGFFVHLECGHKIPVRGDIDLFAKVWDCYLHDLTDGELDELGLAVNGGGDAYAA